MWHMPSAQPYLIRKVAVLVCLLFQGQCPTCYFVERLFYVECVASARLEWRNVTLRWAPLRCLPWRHLPDKYQTTISVCINIFKRYSYIFLKLDTASELWHFYIMYYYTLYQIFKLLYFHLYLWTCNTCAIVTRFLINGNLTWFDIGFFKPEHR